MNINYEKTKVSKLSRHLRVINFNTEDELTVNIVHVGNNWKEVEQWLRDNNCILINNSDFYSTWTFSDNETKNNFIKDWS